MEEGEVSGFAGELQSNATAEKKEQPYGRWRLLIVLAFRLDDSCRDYRRWAKCVVKRAIECNTLIDWRPLHTTPTILDNIKQCTTCRPFLCCLTPFFLTFVCSYLSCLFPLACSSQLLISTLFLSALCLSQSSPFPLISSSVSLSPLLPLPLLVRGSGSLCLLAPRGTDRPLSVSTVGRWVASPPSKPS